MIISYPQDEAGFHFLDLLLGPHLDPVVRALQDGTFGLAVIDPLPAPFELPETELSVVVICDTGRVIYGPSGFDWVPLAEAARCAGNLVVISAWSPPEAPYHRAIVHASEGRSSLIVETHPGRESAWLSFFGDVVPGRWVQLVQEGRP